MHIKITHANVLIRTWSEVINFYTYQGFYFLALGYVALATVGFM